MIYKENTVTFPWLFHNFLNIFNSFHILFTNVFCALLHSLLCFNKKYSLYTLPFLWTFINITKFIGKKWFEIYCRISELCLTWWGSGRDAVRSSWCKAGTGPVSGRGHESSLVRKGQAELSRWSREGQATQRAQWAGSSGPAGRRAPGRQERTAWEASSRALTSPCRSYRTCMGGGGIACRTKKG